MTYLIVNPDPNKQEEKILEITSKLFKEEIPDMYTLQMYPDIHILDPEDANSIGIEEVKNFQNEMVFKPFEKEVQFGILLQSDKLTHQAQNSLLKTLEESDDTTIYLLAVKNEKNLLPTILSRSKTIYISNVVIEEEGSKPEILDLDLVDQFKMLEEISKSKNSAISLLNELEKYYRNVLKTKIHENDNTSLKEVRNILKSIDDTRKKVNANCNKRLVLESLILNLKDKKDLS